jgi:SAM-dependent methyltransferase
VTPSLVYHNAWLYEAIMIGLYGWHYPSRYRAIANLVPIGSRVLDVCCGPALLFRRALRERDVQYTGFDINPRFLEVVRRWGGRAVKGNLLEDRPLPTADTVIMQASLYQFLPDPAPVMRRVFAAARDQVIIAEPIRNLATSRIPFIAALAARQANAGLGDRPSRFSEDTLDAFVASLRFRMKASFRCSGGREKIYVFEPTQNDER